MFILIARLPKIIDRGINEIKKLIMFILVVLIFLKVKKYQIFDSPLKIIRSGNAILPNNFLQCYIAYSLFCTVKISR